MSNASRHRAIRLLTPCITILAAASLFVLSSAHAPAQPLSSPATYYVAPDGDDARDGLAPDHAWRTLARVNSATPAPGSRILFRRGGQWRGQLIPRSGSASAPVTYGAYGSQRYGAYGDDAYPKPVLLGSVAFTSPSDWQPAGPNLWVTAGADRLPCDVGNIIFDHGAAWGIKKWSLKDLQHDFDYYYDAPAHTVTLFSAVSPALRFKSVELALRMHIIDESNRHYVTYENLDLRYGAAHGIGGGNTHHIIVRDCDISWIGGGHQHTRPDGKPVRYGNGVEFWGNARDNLVERCRLWEIYDAALTNQNQGEVVRQENITYRNNVIWNSEYSFEFWNRPKASQSRNILFEHNTCYGAGFGWGHAQRPDPAGRHLCFYFNDAQTQGVVIRDNIFCEATDFAYDAFWWRPETFSDRQVLRLERNCWFQPAGTMIRLKGKAYPMARFADYQRELGQDGGSMATDPRLADPKKLDFRLRPDSPASGLGADIK